MTGFKLVEKLANDLRDFPVQAFDFDLWLASNSVSRDDLDKAWLQENFPGCMSILLNRMMHPMRNEAYLGFQRELAFATDKHNHDLSDEFIWHGQCKLCADFVRSLVPTLSGGEIEKHLRDYRRRYTFSE